MKITAISDTHGVLLDDEWLPAGDVLTISGDLCPDFREDPSFRKQARWFEVEFLPWCRHLVDSGRFHDIVFTPGNHDWMFERVELIPALPPYAHCLIDSSVRIGGVKFHGTPWSNKFFNWAFMADEVFMAERFDRIATDVDVLLSHGPVHGYGDDVLRRKDRLEILEHAGSKALFKRVCEVNPCYVLTGHIHCGSHKPRDIRLGETTTIVNVSVLDDTYYPVHPAFTFEVVPASDDADGTQKK